MLVSTGGDEILLMREELSIALTSVLGNIYIKMGTPESSDNPSLSTVM
jgi:hypothetical protein